MLCWKHTHGLNKQGRLSGEVLTEAVSVGCTNVEEKQFDFFKLKLLGFPKSCML